MVAAEACLVDGECAAHQRFRLAEPVGGLQQPGEVVEGGRDVRMILAEAWLVACSNPARLLRRIATFGWSLPKLASVMASARRISGSASPSRLVSFSNW